MKRTTYLIGLIAIWLVGCASVQQGAPTYCPHDGLPLENITSPTDIDPRSKAPPDTQTTHYTVQHLRCWSYWGHEFFYTNAWPIVKQ